MEGGMKKRGEISRRGEMRNVEQNWLGVEWKRGDKGIERKKRERRRDREGRLERKGGGEERGDKWEQREGGGKREKEGR